MYFILFTFDNYIYIPLTEQFVYIWRIKIVIIIIKYKATVNKHDISYDRSPLGIISWRKRKNSEA